MANAPGALKIDSLPPEVTARDLYGNDIAFPAVIGFSPTYLVAKAFSPSELKGMFQLIQAQRVE